MKTISLSRGEVALVDDSDYRDLMQFKWFIYPDLNTSYAVRKIRIGKSRSLERMHRRVLGLIQNDGKLTDHKNGNGLDNRRNNLRICESRENSRNRTRPWNNTSGYKGVVWHQERWQAQIGVNRQCIYLGRFVSKTDAALAYNTAAIKYHGEFARLNAL